MFQTEREYNAAALDNMRKQMCILRIKACEAILIVLENKIMNLKMSIMSPLKLILEKH